MMRACAVRGCGGLAESPARYCDRHIEEVAALRADPHLLDADALTEMDSVSSVLSWFVVGLARTDPFTVGDLVERIRSDPDGWARTVQATRTVVAHDERWDPASTKCDSCRATVTGTIRVRMADDSDGRGVDGRVCEDCYRLVDLVVYRTNPWWCPRCKARPDSPFCLCQAEDDPPELRLGRQLGNQDTAVSMAAASLLALTERHRPASGLRVGTSDKSHPITVRAALDDLEGARLAFVLAQLARRHYKEGNLGPGWRRRTDAKDVPLASVRGEAEADPARALIGRLHAVRGLQMALRVATPAQLRAVHNLIGGETLSGADRKAKYHLAKRLRELGLEP